MADEYVEQGIAALDIAPDGEMKQARLRHHAIDVRLRSQIIVPFSLSKLLMHAMPSSANNSSNRTRPISIPAAYLAKTGLLGRAEIHHMQGHAVSPDADSWQLRGLSWISRPSMATR